MTLFDQKIAATLAWFKRRDQKEQPGAPKPVKDGGTGNSKETWTTLPAYVRS